MPMVVQIKRLCEKYGYQVPADIQSEVNRVSHTLSAHAASETGVAPVKPFLIDYDYHMPVTIGGIKGDTPQTYRELADTGSSVLWVLDKGAPANLKQGHTIYPDDGINLNRSYSASYAGGDVENGTAYKDTVTIGGLTANSNLGAADVSTTGVLSYNADGLMGLSPPQGNKLQPGNLGVTWLHQVFPQLPQQVFTADLKHQAPGEFDFGFIDISKALGPIAYSHSNFGSGFWEVTVDGYVIGGNDSTPKSASQIAIIDSGTSPIVVTPDMASDYWAAVSGARSSSETGIYIYPCNTPLPDFGFVVGGQTRTCAGSYIAGTPFGPEGMCEGNLQSQLAGADSMTIGSTFMKSQLFVFDYGNKRVRLGQKARGR